MCWAVIRDGFLGGNKALCENLASENTSVRHPLGWSNKQVFIRSRASRFG
jgi:hypothetical protein